MAQVVAGLRFATRLVAAREALGKEKKERISQETLANAYLDVTKATVGNWETGKTLPGFADLWRCCEVFGWDRCAAAEWIVQDELDRRVAGPFVISPLKVAA